MSFTKAKKLINDAIEKKVLSGHKNSFVMVYRNQSDNMPEGWYKDPIDKVARELSNDELGIKELTKALETK
jgi:hypothetical protein